MAFTEFDAGLGVLTKLTDPNHLVTQRAYDSFGRLGLETRPDRTQTAITLSRTKDERGWRLTQRTTTTGGGDDTVEVDSLGRAIQWRYGAVLPHEEPFQIGVNAGTRRRYEPQKNKPTLLDVIDDRALTFTQDLLKGASFSRFFAARGASAAPR